MARQYRFYRIVTSRKKTVNTRNEGGDYRDARVVIWCVLFVFILFIYFFWGGRISQAYRHFPHTQEINSFRKDVS